ncbi:MAG: GNAT family N-acetyltransferase [Chitinophagaceae bacterium]|nr:GNAT family N-acetyltransferase [Oligoflexus sp.]
MDTFRIRKISAEDDAPASSIIKKVLTEYGLNREGFAFVDAELEALSKHYIAPRALYFVAEVNGVIVGGAGFGPLLGEDAKTAELKKMYLVKEGRGLGIGAGLMREILTHAAGGGYARIYLETMPEMTDAIRLYEKSGFQAISEPMGNTGHHGCQAFFVKTL